MKRKLLITTIVIVALLLARVAFHSPQPASPAASEPPPELQALLLSELRPLTPFALTDHNGKALGLEQFKGQWSLIFFGYTHCPDICPTTLGMLKGVAKKLKETPEINSNTRFLFVSVDPKRDSLPYLKEYIGYFNQDFIAATGERQEIDNLARQLGAVYMFEGDTEKDDYIVNHSASVALVDPQGQWVARFNPPHTVKQFHSDYLKLRDYLKNTTPQD